MRKEINRRGHVLNKIKKKKVSVYFNPEMYIPTYAQIIKIFNVQKRGRLIFLIEKKHGMNATRFSGDERQTSKRRGCLLGARYILL